MKVGRRAWFAIAAWLPTVVVFWVAGCFVWNHFVEGPALHDAGWGSALVWRTGLLPKSPVVAHPLRDFYGVHVSPLLSVTSLLSYAAPIGRVRWYALFHGAIHAPLGVVTALLVHERGRKATLREGALVAVVALLFALDGQVIVSLVYPHFEVFASAGLCVMLVGFATGRARLAWLGLVLSVMTREDGGAHAALFAGAVVASDLLGRPFPIARRSALAMAVVGIIATVVALGVQKTFFPTADLFRAEYLGEPALAHLSGHEIARRFGVLCEHATFVPFPLLATVVVAIARRDARYLLGWAVELPWLALNLFAAQEAKVVFSGYTGFPFIASIFWVGAYARIAPRGPGLRWLESLAFVSTVATLGMLFVAPGMFGFLGEHAVVPRRVAPKVEEFAATLTRDPRSYGSLYVDPGVASWAIETMPLSDRLWNGNGVTSFENKDGAAFFLRGIWAGTVFPLLARSPFTTCGRIPDSEVYFCAREGKPLPPGFVASAPLVALLQTGLHARRDGETLLVEPTPALELQVFGPYLALPAGSYVARWRVRSGACLAGGGPRFGIDVSTGGRVLAAREIEGDEQTVEAPFDLPADATGLELRAWSGRCAFVLEDLSLRAP